MTQDPLPSGPSSMLTFGYMALALLMGVGFATQVTMLSAMGKLRGPLEATWLSLVGTVAGFTLIMALKAALGAVPVLPRPFARPLVFVVVAAFAVVGAVLLVKGIAPYFAFTGLLAIPLLVSASFLGPRIGVGLYLSSVIAGQLIGSAALDHIGAFGTTVHRIDAMRVAGIGALLIGVVLIRGVRS
jgi:transporter family-2 protein